MDIHATSYTLVASSSSRSPLAARLRWLPLPPPPPPGEPALNPESLEPVRPFSYDVRKICHCPLTQPISTIVCFWAISLLVRTSYTDRPQRRDHCSIVLNLDMDMMLANNALIFLSRVDYRQGAETNLFRAATTAFCGLWRWKQNKVNSIFPE